MDSKQSSLDKAATKVEPTTQPKQIEDKQEVIQEPKLEEKIEEKIQDPEELIKPLKELITALERRQKVAQEVGDYRTVLQSLVSGELLSGEELERAKQVIQSLGKLVKATVDHQNALAAAAVVMPALDKILGVQKKS